MAWKTGWIFQVFRRQSWHVMGDKTLVMVKGPSLFGANFGLVTEHFKFRPSSLTFSPFLKGMNFC